MSIAISYSDDEVKIFHPKVEKSINNFLKKNKLDSKYELEHHPLSITKGIPDFIIKDKKSKKWLFVIEVKRTPSSVKAVGTWNQGRDYVVDNKVARWDSTKKPFFMVTNMEISYYFADRQGEGVQFCLLKNGEVDCGLFSKGTTSVISEFSNKAVVKIFELLEQQKVEFSDHLELVLHKYVGYQENLSNHIKTLEKNILYQPTYFGFKNKSEYQKKMQIWMTQNDPRAKSVSFGKISQELSRDCLFRIFVYEYSREYFKGLSIHNELKKINHNDKLKAFSSITACFSDLRKIDFLQILDERLMSFVPENLDDNVFAIIKDFIATLQTEIQDAIKESGSPNSVLNMFVENEDFYPWKEVNGDGKVMTDPQLADFITSMCFDIFGRRKIPSVYDPGCGTSNFLKSSYDKIKSLNSEITHNKILSYLHGSEVDRFLGKLGVFGMVMQSPNEIDNKTEVDIRLEDFFDITSNELGKYDIVLMNPPFLRNDNKTLPLHRKVIENKIKKLLKKDSVIKKVPQPNYYFYFVEVASRIIKDNGIVGFILMNTFLNTDNGKILKKILLENYELLYIISIPSSYFFTKHMVTPCIVIAKKKKKPDPKNKVRFVRVSNQNFFNVNFLNTLSKTNISAIDDAEIKILEQSSLDAGDNWKSNLFVSSIYYNILEKSPCFEDLGRIFEEIKRGDLANEGSGSPFFFPWSTSKINFMSNEISKIGSKFQKLGMNNADKISNYVFTKKNLEQQPVLGIKKSVKINQNKGIENFLKKWESKEAKNKKLTIPKRWNIDNFTSNAQIIIPRSSRLVQSVALNPFWKTDDVYFSSNFICCINCNLKIISLDKNKILRYITAFLNSSFAQLIFELESQNREGLRKIELGKMKSKILIPTKKLDENVLIIKEIISKFDKLPFCISGEENISPRQELDVSIAKLLLKIEPELLKIAKTPEKFAEKIEDDLKDIVRDRKGI